MNLTETDSPKNHFPGSDYPDNDALVNHCSGNQSTDNYTSSKLTQRLEALIERSPIPDSQLRQLLSNTLNISYFELARRKSLGQLRFTESQAQTLIRSIEQLTANPDLPVQHLTGSVHFGGVDLQVGPGVFIPRPETELMLELLPVAPQPPHGQRLLDLGAGSGAIGLAFKLRYPELTVDLVEKSPTALKYLRRNVNAYNRGLTAAEKLSRADSGKRPLTSRSATTPVRVYQTDMLDLLTSVTSDSAPHQSASNKSQLQYDYIVCNPPYIPTTEKIFGAAAHDPVEALFAGNTGLDLITQIIRGVPPLLNPQGILLLEHHSSQRSAIVELFEKFSWRDIQAFDDLNGCPRFARAHRPKASSVINGLH